MQGGFQGKHERRLIVTCPEDSLYIYYSYVRLGHRTWYGAGTQHTA